MDSTRKLQESKEMFCIGQRKSSEDELFEYFVNVDNHVSVSYVQLLPKYTLYSMFSLPL